MRSLPVFRPSASLVLHHVPQTMTKDDINKIFTDFQPLDNIVFHYITPNIYTECVTVVLESTESAKKFSTENFNHTIPDTNINFHYSFRINDCSLNLQHTEEVVQKPQVDDVPPDFNPFTKNYFISDWNHFNDLKNIPEDSILINLRYNEIESFDIAFESLTTLNLIGNNLKYMISLTKLPNLQNLNISFNCLQHLPSFSEAISNIDASYNQLVDIDSSIINARSLTIFNVSHNQIKIVPPLPPDIKRLYLNSNHIEKLDLVSISHRLSEFKIDNNKLTDIPALEQKIPTQNLSFNSFNMFNLSVLGSNIREVNLCMCNLTEFPAKAFETRSLSSLILCGNNIKEIPPQFSNSRITSLDVSMNPIDYLPPVPPGMQNLRINHCNISDVCSSIPNTNSIKFFYAVGNKITKLPDFNRIEELFVSGNLITDFPVLSNISKKKVYLDISHNKITSIPENLRMDFSLFDISYNPITNIPLHIMTENTASYNFSGISELKMELNDSQMPKVSFLNIFGTQIKIVPPKLKLKTIVDSLSTESDLTDPDIYHFECNSSVGFSDTIGKRETMEDSMVIRQHFAVTTLDPSSSQSDTDPNPKVVKTAIFGLFDGHGGPNVSRWAAVTFADLFKLYMEGKLGEDFSGTNHDSNKQQSSTEELSKTGNGVEIPLHFTKELDENAIIDICSYFHGKIVSANESSGSTMEFVILHSTGKVIISHIGDSKTVIYDREGNPVYSNVEQRPDLRSEMERLRSEKVKIRRNRTAGILAMSRSLGDVQICGVSHEPTYDVLELNLDRESVSKNKWLVLACDGVWDDVDVISAGKIVARANDARKAATFLRDEGMARRSEDNISAIVVDLEKVFDD